MIGTHLNCINKSILFPYEHRIVTGVCIQYTKYKRSYTRTHCVCLYVLCGCGIRAYAWIFVLMYGYVQYARIHTISWWVSVSWSSFFFFFVYYCTVYCVLTNSVNDTIISNVCARLCMFEKLCNVLSPSEHFYFANNILTAHLEYFDPHTHTHARHKYMEMCIDLWCTSGIVI